MLLPITSNHKRFLLKLGITAFKPFVMGIKAYDPLVANTHYFRRKVTFRPNRFSKGNLRYTPTIQRNLEIPFPISPKQLALELIDKTDKQERRAKSFQIDYLEIEALPPANIWASAEQHRFMDHAIDFAQKCGYLASGYYTSPDHESLIQYLPRITDSLGKELVTPARIHREMPRVQVSQRMFQQFSIPVRVAILAHEGCHFFNNTRNEKEADLCGIKYYLDAGFPRIEAVYAATKVFRMHPHTVGPSQVERTKTIIDFIDAYKKSQMEDRQTLQKINR